MQQLLLVFRIGQAVIATAMVLSRAVIRDLYTQDQSAPMIGYVTMGMALVPMISPAIGGALQQMFDWHATSYQVTIFAVSRLEHHRNLELTVQGSNKFPNAKE